MSDRAQKRLRALLALAALLVLGVVVLRTFVGDVYPVASSSMEPALRPGERVFMRYGRQGLERFDLVVVTDTGGGPIVKRLAGLPGETVTLTPAGDLLIDDAPLPPEAPRPAPVPIFDDQLLAVEESFLHGSSSLDPWRQDGAVWELDGREVAPGSSAGLLRYRKNLSDDRLAPDGTWLAGSTTVGDVILECQVQALEPGGVLRFELVEGRVTYQARVELVALDSCTVELRSSLQEAPLARLRDLRLDLASWQPVRFSNVDDSLVLELGGARVSATVTPPANLAQGAFGERVRLGGEGCRARFRGLRILRDLHYTGRGEYAVGRRLTLGPDEIFVLGDNSASSLDSREFGPVPLESVLGQPTWVVWPLGRARPLGAR